MKCTHEKGKVVQRYEKSISSICHYYQFSDFLAPLPTPGLLSYWLDTRTDCSWKNILLEMNIFIWCLSSLRRLLFKEPSIERTTGSRVASFQRSDLLPTLFLRVYANYLALCSEIWATAARLPPGSCSKGFISTQDKKKPFFSENKI